MVGLALYLIYFISTVVIDYEHIKSQYFIYSHTSRWVQRLSAILAIGSIGVELFTLSHLLQVLGYGLLFTGTFDNTLNLFRGKEIGHLGYTAKWDLFWRNHYPFYIILNVACIAMGGYLIYKTL